MAETKNTTDHETIRRWVEARGGRPAHVKGTGGKDDPGILRIDFGAPDDALEAIDWEEFFAKFDENGLSFLYQEKDGQGKDSRFNKFISRDSHDRG
ncbi:MULTISPECIES: hypothetical protein [unclassified Azospirillum]|uniref:hypothetical protein n=1 Tax=unclassified Azospirillum TaxID=2630922 RepID=UPI000B720521|nr:MULTISPECIES: hypothetical protein [unclassified Azospirillum]SNS11041.1 hypothetical protein SAMN05880556_10214 [Azospirillum sp. RU38E]SNS27752.1 hypothetical protein SAMN05880591_10214 [Azospirillum sp. RU37A]